MTDQLFVHGGLPYLDESSNLDALVILGDLGAFEPFAVRIAANCHRDRQLRSLDIL